MRQGLSIGAAGAAVGLVVGVMLGSGKGGVVPLGGAGALGSSPSTSTGTGTSTTTAGADPEAHLAAAIERLDRAAAALEAAANAMKGSAAALGEARGAASPGPRPAGDARRLGGEEAGPPVAIVTPGARPPGALVEWLPPEGVPLVKAWYQRNLATRLEALEQRVAERPDDRMDAFQLNLARSARDALSGVDSELALARWIDQHGSHAVGPPKPWQLAEFAKTWDGK